MLELKLSRLKRQISIARLVAENRLTCPIEGEVHVTVDEARRNKLSRTINHLGTVRNIDVASWSHCTDPVSGQNDGSVHEWWATVSIDDCCTNDGDRTLAH